MDSLRKTLQEILDSYQSTRGQRQKLTWQQFKPVPLPSLVPKVEDRKQSSTDEMVIRREHQREKRTVMREMRRDGLVSAQEKLDLQKQKDQAYAERMRRVEGSLGNEVGAYRSDDRKNGNKKKR